MAPRLCFIYAAVLWVVVQGAVIDITPEKSGNCPASSPDAGICVFDPKVNCLFDSACPGQEKCCPEGCGKVCKLPCPEYECLPLCKEVEKDERGCPTCRCKKPIVCPLIKCAVNCLRFVKDKNGCPTCKCEPKPGNCPKPAPIVCVRSIFECHQDEDCHGAQKCCRVPCGTKCSLPVRVADSPPAKCRPDEMVQCLVNPCLFARCSVPGAKCVPNYCRGCKAEFFDKDGNRVCERGFPVEN